MTKFKELIGYSPSFKDELLAAYTNEFRAKSLIIDERLWPAKEVELSAGEVWT